MIRLGVTGGIGSGKSTICRVFQLLGVPIYYADARAKWLIENNLELVESIKRLLGEESYVKGEYNSRYVGSKVFRNSDLLAKLNNLVHPAVQDDWVQWCRSRGDHRLLIKEAAIMGPASAVFSLDKVLYVYSSESLRLSRVSKRDSFRSKESIQSIIAKQRSEASYREISDFEIDNNDKRLVIPQVMSIFEKLINTTS